MVAVSGCALQTKEQGQGDKNRWIGKEGLGEINGDGNRYRADKQHAGSETDEKEKKTGTEEQGQSDMDRRTVTVGVEWE